MVALALAAKICLSLLALTPVQAFVGMGINMYNPSCAYACRSVIAGASIECPSSAATSTCQARSGPFLTTLAYCIKTRCYPDPNPSREQIEAYWSIEATGDEDAPPMWGWQEAVDRVNGTPSAKYDPKSKMRETVLLDQKDWLAAKQKMEASEYQQVLYARYALTIFLVGIGTPILLTALTYLPYSRVISDWVRPRLIYPTLFRRHVQPVLYLFHLPTLGQSTYILLITILTITLLLVDYGNLFPFRTSTEADILNYLGMRTGIIAMALLPLTILFAGRNNLLLYLSNWSHSTYLLLHRWIARLCLFVIILHSLIEFVRYTLQGRYAAEVAKTYVQWGIVGLFACFLAVLTAHFRRWGYELFLISHIVLVVIFIVGTWYHLELKFQRERGYQQWIYLCSAIWFFDRLVRLGRVLRTGRRKAVVSKIGDEVVRVDIEGVRWSATPGQHAYLFLPAVRKWAPWENHPFSVIPTHLLQKRCAEKGEMDEKNSPQTSASASTADLEIARQLHTPVLSSIHTTPSGVTVFIKRNKGITAALHSHASPVFTALMDGPYRNTSSRPVLTSDRLILFTGGIGITGVLPFVHAHPNVKLFWSVRAGQEALVEELEPTLPAHVERGVRVGGRNSIEAALEAEVAAGWKNVGVVVCGPGKMCDEVRNRVAELGRRAAVKWELDVEAFLW